LTSSSDAPSGMGFVFDGEFVSFLGHRGIFKIPVHIAFHNIKYLYFCVSHGSLPLL
jgi:hypothetical protein